MRMLTGRMAAVLMFAAAGACAQAPVAQNVVDAPVVVRSPGRAADPSMMPPVTSVAPAPAPQPVADVPAATPAWVGRLEAAVKANSYQLDYDGKTFSGPAWDRLVAEGQAAQFFLLGEEHGIAENPKLAGQLFERLAKDGYSKFVIEVSPPMATALDEAAKDGIGGLRAQLLSPSGAAAFFTMQEEAEMLARVRAAVSGARPALWGVDYEVGGDRLLIGRLEKMPKPKAAQEALATLRAASEAGWAKHAAEKNPQFIFTFSGDPDLVRAVRTAWPDATPAASEILLTLEETLEINRLWVQGKAYDSNVRRSTYMRRNFLAHWNAERAAGRKPKVFAKMGSSHLVRGRNSTETYDIGTLAPDLALIEGVTTFQVMILPGKGRQTAVFNPVSWMYESAEPKDNYNKGMEPVIDSVDPAHFTLVDLRPLRPILGFWRQGIDPELMRMVHGYDMLLVMSGSTASANLTAQ